MARRGPLLPAVWLGATDSVNAIDYTARARRRGSAMTPQQLRAFRVVCDYMPGTAPGQRQRAVELVMDHLERRTPARWLPDILYAHGLPRHAKALDEILAR
jgi:hypothetical protein